MSSSIFAQSECACLGILGRVNQMPSKIASRARIIGCNVLTPARWAMAPTANAIIALVSTKLHARRSRIKRLTQDRSSTASDSGTDADSGHVQPLRQDLGARDDTRGE